MKVAIFDLDDTLIHEGFENPVECNEALDCIKYCDKKGYIVCIATMNQCAKVLCRKTSFKNYIDLIIASYTKDYKKYHLTKIINYYDCDPKDCIFFDDISENIEQARKLGIKSKLVNWKKGVTLNNVKTTIKKHCNKNKAYLIFN